MTFNRPLTLCFSPFFSPLETGAVFSSPGGMPGVLVHREIYPPTVDGGAPAFVGPIHVEPVYSEAQRRALEQETLSRYYKVVGGNTVISFSHLSMVDLLWTRDHVDELSVLFPSTGEGKHSQLRDTFLPPYIPVIRRHGLQHVREIFRDHPERCGWILNKIQSLPRLLSRIGVRSFVEIARTYERAEEIIGDINRIAGYHEYDEYQGMECSIEDQIGSASDLLNWARQVDEFRRLTDDLTEGQCYFNYSAYLAKKYGIENLVFLGQIARLVGPRPFKWVDHWEKGKCHPILRLELEIKYSHPLIDRFGMAFVADAYERTKGQMCSLTKHIDSIQELYTQPDEILSMLDSAPKTCVGNAIAGLFGISENRCLVQKFGMPAVARIVDGLNYMSCEYFFPALAACAHLLSSEEDLDRIGCAIWHLHEGLPINDDSANVRRKVFSHVVSVVRTVPDFERAAQILAILERRVFVSLDDVLPLIDSVERIEEVTGILNVSALWLLPGVKQDIHSMDDLREFASLSLKIQNILGANKDSQQQESEMKEVVALCTSRERMRLWLALRKEKIIPTDYLLKNLALAEDQRLTLSQWVGTLASFRRGGFDATNELHRNLEYTRFRAIVDHEKMRRHVKNHFTFEQYEAIFRRPGNPAMDELPDCDRFELECATHEARLLHEFIRQVATRAEELGMPVVVGPNLSYGYLPVAPLMEMLEKDGVEVAIGMKVGSTESHENKEVIDGRLFKGHRRRFIQGQPILIIVDGTQHMVDREGDGKAGRYPDAYQGYLNQVIAMNDAMGFTDLDYSNVGKDESDLKRLRATPEFQRLVGVYCEFIAGQDHETRRPYTFHLWNTAGMDLIIRGDRQELLRHGPVVPAEIEGPAMIFCNVGVLDSQIPESIKERYSGQEHTPAYFDDSGRILDFDFGYDQFGVRYLNRLETELKRLYNGEAAAASMASAFIEKLRTGIQTFHIRQRPEEENRPSL